MAPRNLRAWRLAIEALAWLAIAGVILRTRSFERVTQAASRRIRPSVPRTPFDAEILDAVRRAILAAARRAPWRTVCFDRGLAAHLMLRRRKIPSQMCYGARSDGSEGVSAHVWVRSGGRIVVGGEGSERFAVLAVFPSDGEGSSGERDE